MSPLPAVEAIYATGMWLMEQRRPADASHVFRALLIAAPADERGWLALGACHEVLDQTATAITLYELGSGVAAGGRCHVATARIHRARGEDVAASESLDKAHDAAERLDDEELREIIQYERNIR